MNTYRVFFIKEKTEVTVKEGTTVLEAERIAGLSPDAPCGGAGKCGTDIPHHLPVQRTGNGQQHPGAEGGGVAAAGLLYGGVEHPVSGSEAG